MNKKLIIASTSTVYGSGYLDYLKPTLSKHFKNVKEIIFIPYARPNGITHDAYTSIVSRAFAPLGITIKGLHTSTDVATTLKNAQGIFTGGGNTFVLVHALYTQKALEPLRQAIHMGVPYLGTSAGSNICGLTMQTTNDMPIIYPPSFKTLGVTPYNINPHYLDPDKNTTHMGETRETRIKEYHSINNVPVVGLREGSWITVDDKISTIEGPHTARIFEQGKPPYEIESGSIIGF